jgi:DNA-binding XRE family transcriptional regulator|tara:strand:+ start:1531 stop:1833 length:303 start_codon:yes stop_codon:yes gene_type:complete
MARTLEQLLASEKPEVVAAARAETDEILLDLRLSEVRRLVEMTQAQMADAMGIRQPTVAGMEKDEHDLRLSSLKRYVEAAGGRVRIHVELPDGSHYGFPI